jgi:hypothetical protein
MSEPGGDEVVVINLISTRPGVDPAAFEEFSAALDQPICLSKEVVLSFDAYRVSTEDAAAVGADIVEVMHVASWSEWEHVRDHDPDLKPVTDGFDALADPATVRTLFVTPVRRR